MFALAHQLQKYFAEAESKADARMKELRDSLIDEFAKTDTNGKTEAFSDPDYQFVLRDAHQVYARSGDESLREELVKLLVQRSAEPTGSRTALILNQAIAAAGSLTRQEYAALCGIFLFKYCRVNAADPDGLYRTLREIVGSFVYDLPFDNHAYEYLESLGIISVNRITGVDLSEILHQSYASIITFGFSRIDLGEAVGDDIAPKLNTIIIPDMRSFKFNLRFNIQDAAELNAFLKEIDISGDAANRITAFFQQSLMPTDQLWAKLMKDVPDLQWIQDLWTSTEIHQATLTALGKVMAHSALISRSTFLAPLNIWVR